MCFNFRRWLVYGMFKIEIGGTQIFGVKTFLGFCNWQSFDGGIWKIVDSKLALTFFQKTTLILQNVDDE